MTTTTKAAIVVFLATAMAGCGDSGAAGAGRRGGDALVRGTVQGLDGGLRVNGVRFDTNGARFRDGSADAVVLSGSPSGRLAAGDTVMVRGTVGADGDAGVATEILAYRSVDGAVESTGAGWMMVSGVMISVDDSAQLAGAATFGAGDRVSVAGLGNAQGGISATRVEKTAATELEQEATGWIVAIDGSVLSISFTKDGPVALRVDTSGVTAMPSLTVGDLVEVKTLGPADGSGVFGAVRVHEEDDLKNGAAGLWVELEDIVTVVDGTGFELGGQRVTASDSTEWEGGTVEDLVAGVKVEVEGRLGDDGVLAARKISFRPNVRVEANVEAVDEENGTVQLLGLTVHLTPSSERRGFSSLSSLALGYDVEVRGTPTRDGTGINATRIELRDTRSTDRAFLRGVVTEKTPTTGLVVYGIAVDTSGAQYRDHADKGMTASAFFDAITPGKSIVKVRWRPYPSSTADAIDEAELEDD